MILSFFKVHCGSEESKEDFFRRILVAWCAWVGVAIILMLSALSFNFGLNDAFVVDLFYAVLVMVSALVNRFLPKRNKLAVDILLFSVVVFPSIVTWLSGGFANSGARSVWVFLAPIGSLAFLGKRESIVLMCVFTLSLGASILLPTPYHGFGIELGMKMMAFNLVGVFVFAFSIFYIFNAKNIKQTQVIKEKTLLEESARVKDEFLNVMSHEIRTPLNAIIGTVDILVDETKDDSAQNEQLKIVQYSSSNLLYLINDILDYSKLESGKLEIEKLPFELKKVVQNTVSVFLDKAKEGNVELKLEIADNVSEFYSGNNIRLGQILNNLISNAIKFSSNGTVNVFVFQEKNLIIKVVDSGIGMSAEQLKNIFIPFSQADKTISRKFGGTGLGLSIIKKIVDQSGGKLTVESEAGKGSSFTVELPWNVVKQKSIKELEANDYKDKLVVIVDDNELNLKIASRLISKLGAETLCFDGGQKCVDWLKENHCDLILMDLQMPDLDGISTVKKIRESIPKHKLNILALSAEARDNTRDAVLEAGMQDFVPKPINKKVLIKNLNQWLA
ncbi:ATP-binding protein [Fibrobacterales bacterium]|nr:ATP-binding protein [Fibrobacterales bacterium]